MRTDKPSVENLWVFISELIGTQLRAYLYSYTKIVKLFRLCK